MTADPEALKDAIEREVGGALRHGIPVESIAKRVANMVAEAALSVPIGGGDLDHKCFECDGELMGPYCPACNPPNWPKNAALIEAALEWAEIDNLTSPPCTAEMLKASDRRLFAAVRAYAIDAATAPNPPAEVQSGGGVKIIVGSEWLSNHVENDPDLDVEAASPKPIESALPIARAPGHAPDCVWYDLGPYPCGGVPSRAPGPSTDPMLAQAIEVLKEAANDLQDRVNELEKFGFQALAAMWGVRNHDETQDFYNLYRLRLARENFQNVLHRRAASAETEKVNPRES